MNPFVVALVGWTRRGARSVGWYVGSLMGDTAYRSYLAHHHSVHSHQPPLTEREFWVKRYRDQGASPTSRCC